MTAAQTAWGLADRCTQPRAAETRPGQLHARGCFTKILRRKPPHPGRVRARLCELRARNARMHPCRSAHGRAPASSGAPGSRSSSGQSGGFLNRRQEVRVLPGAPFICPIRGQEVQQSRSPPVFQGAAGTVKARRSDRGREEPLLSRRLMTADNRRVRSVWQSDSAARETAALSVTAEGYAHTRPPSCGTRPRSEEHPYAIFKRRSDLAGPTTRSGIPA